MPLDLILHAGLSKTATTTIQNRLMQGAPHYLGRDETGEGEIVSEIKDLARRWPFLPEADVSNRTQEWTAKVLAEAQRRNLSTSVALSCEQLLNWRIYDSEFRKTGLAVSPRSLPWRQAGRSGSWPLASFLTEHLVPAWSSQGRVRLVVTLRRQPDWLASQYAQMSARVFAPSQADFEAQVKELIARNDPYILWDGLLRELSAAVGAGNLSVFLFEELSTPETWTELATAMGLAPDDPRIALARQGRSNQRAGDAQNSWNIRPSRLKMAEQFVEICWPERRFSALRSAALAAAGVIDAQITRRVVPRSRKDTPQTIQLTDELSQLVRNYCAASNQELSKILNKDLKALGY